METMKTLTKIAGIALALSFVWAGTAEAQVSHEPPPSTSETVGSANGNTTGTTNSQGRTGHGAFTQAPGGGGTLTLPSGTTRSRLESQIGSFMTSILQRYDVISFGADGQLDVGSGGADDADAADGDEADGDDGNG